MRAGTDAQGQAAITAATDWIVESLLAKNERVDARARMRIERDVAGTFAWLVTRYRAVDDERGHLEGFAKKLIAGALEVDDLQRWAEEVAP